MQRVVSKYGTAAHLAFLAVAPLFLSPTVVLWLAGLALVTVLMEPSRLGGESLAAARKRSFSALMHDPFSWACLVGVGYAAMCWANSGIAMVFDAESSLWALSRPFAESLPGSVEGFGFPTFSGAVAFSVVLVGCRNALGRKARMAFLYTAGMFAGLIALVWSLRLSQGSSVEVALAACSLEDPSFKGSVFGLFLIASISVLPHVIGNRWHVLSMLAVLGVGGNALGLFLFSPPAVSAVFAILAVLALLYGVVYAYVVQGAPAGLKVMVLSVLFLCAAALLTIFVMPSSVVLSKTDSYANAAFEPDGFRERRDILSRVAEEGWRANPWTGIGLGAYAFDLKFRAEPDEWEVLSDRQKAPLNGGWMLLAERGIVGSSILAILLALLLCTYVYRFVIGVLKAFPAPVCLFGFFTLLAVAAEALVDVTFLSPAMLTAAALFLSVAAALFPKERSNV